MTRQELIRLYTDGQLPRREFVRRLTVAGVSAGAAVAYAQTLAPSASAATGHLDLLQQVGADYGGPIDPGDVEAVIEAIVALLDAFIDFLDAALDNFESNDFADFLNGLRDVFADLQNLNGQIDSERSTLAAATSAATLSVAPVKRRLLAAARLAQTQSPDEFVADLGDVLDVQCQLYAGLVPAVEDAELQAQLSSLAIVKGEQAAYVRLLRGTSPFPSGTESPIGIQDAQDQIEAILAD